jgi:hypothetical protein
MVMGALSTESDGKTPSFSQSRAYCIPGDTDTCDPPVAEWKFDEKTGETVYDTSGNGHTGSFENSPTWERGKFGAALGVGSDDRIYVGTSPNLQPSDITVSAWVKRTESWSGTGVSNVFFWAKDDAVTWNYASGWYFESVDDDGGAYPDRAVNLVVGGGNLFYVNEDPDSFYPFNEWVYIAASFDSDTNDMNIYKNGVEQPVSTYGTPDIINSNSESKRIGITNGHSIGGQIDELRIYDYVRTPAQIAWDYNRGKPVGHWKFDEGEGTIAADYSGNRNHGTLTLMDPPTDWVTGKFGKALDFAGDNDYVITSAPATTQTDNWTMSAWINPSSVSQHGVIMNNGRETGSGATSYGYTMAIGDCSGGTGTIFCGIANGSGWIPSGYNFPSANTWYHVVMLRDSGTTKFYVNGVQTSQTSAQSYKTPTGQVTVGAFQPWNSKFFAGQIDDVRIYNYALNEYQVRQIYNNGAAIMFGE